MSKKKVEVVDGRFVVDGVLYRFVEGLYVPEMDASIGEALDYAVNPDAGYVCSCGEDTFKVHDDMLECAGCGRVHNVEVFTFSELGKGITGIDEEDKDNNLVN